MIAAATVGWGRGRLGQTALIGLLLLGAAAGTTCLAADPTGIDATVHDIMDRRCSECHGADLKKPKGRFGFVTDLQRMARDPDLVVPGEPMDSELYLLLTAPDPDDRMPPPDSERSGTMTPAEIALVKAWIEALGAGHQIVDPTPAAEGPSIVAGAMPEPHSHTEPAPAAEPATGTWRQLGLGHLLILHFPIALLIVLVPSNLWTAYSGCVPQRRTDRFLLWTAVPSCALAILTGFAAADLGGYRPDTIALHQWTAVATGVLALLALLAHEAERHWGLAWLRRTELLLVLAAAALAAVAGHAGGDLVHDQTLF